MTFLANVGSTIKAYWWVFVAAGLLTAGWFLASYRMKVKALEMQVEALQSLRDAKARRKVRDDTIETEAEAEKVTIVEERDETLAELDQKAEKLDATHADHDALDAVDDEVNAFLEAEHGKNRPDGV